MMYDKSGSYYVGDSENARLKYVGYLVGSTCLDIRTLCRWAFVGEIIQRTFVAPLWSFDLYTVECLPKRSLTTPGACSQAVFANPLTCRRLYNEAREAFPGDRTHVGSFEQYSN